MSLHPSDIQDAALRALLEAANAALDDGRNRQCIERCGEAYLQALKQFPPMMRGLQRSLANAEVKAGIDSGVIRVAPFMWPRFVAKLDMSGPEPAITFDRAGAAFTEAIQYYEFTLNIIHEAETGRFTFAQRFAGQGA